MFPGFKEIIEEYAPVEIELLELWNRVSYKDQFLRRVNKWLPMFTQAYFGETVTFPMHMRTYTTRCSKCNSDTESLTFEYRLKATWRILRCGHIENAEVIHSGLYRSLKDLIDNGPRGDEGIMDLMDMCHYGWIKTCEYEIPKTIVKGVCNWDITMAILHLFFYYFRKKD